MLSFFYPDIVRKPGYRILMMKISSSLDWIVSIKKFLACRHSLRCSCRLVGSVQFHRDNCSLGAIFSWCYKISNRPYGLFWIIRLIFSSILVLDIMASSVMGLVFDSQCLWKCTPLSHSFDCWLTEGTFSCWVFWAWGISGQCHYCTFCDRVAFFYLFILLKNLCCSLNSLLWLPKPISSFVFGLRKLQN